MMSTSITIPLSRWIESANKTLFNLDQVIGIEHSNSKITVYTSTEEIHLLYEGLFDMCSKLMNKIKSELNSGSAFISIPKLVEQLS